jgi:hypothetical protein
MHEDPDGGEAGPLVHGDRAPVEGGDREDELRRLKAGARVIESRLNEGSSQTLSCALRVEAQADLERPGVLPLEREVADQGAGAIFDRDVSVTSQCRVEQLREIVGILCPVVEREGLGIVPEGNRLRLCLSQWPEVERCPCLFATRFARRRHTEQIIAPKRARADRPREL